MASHGAGEAASSKRLPLHHTVLSVIGQIIPLVYVKALPLLSRLFALLTVGHAAS